MNAYVDKTYDAERVDSMQDPGEDVESEILNSGGGEEENEEENEEEEEVEDEWVEVEDDGPSIQHNTTVSPQRSADGMDVVSENVRESNHATTTTASLGERDRSAAGEGNAATVTDSSTEGITTAGIRERQRRIDAYDMAKEKIEDEHYEKFDEWLRDSTTELLVEYEGMMRIRTFDVHPRLVAVRFLDRFPDPRLKHGVVDSSNEVQENIRNCFEGGFFRQGLGNDFRASQRILRHEIAALCDCDVDKISSFRDFDNLFESVKAKVEGVLPDVMVVINEKNEKVQAIRDHREKVKAFVAKVVEKETEKSADGADGAFCELIKVYKQDAWADVANMIGNLDKKYHLIRFLENECEKQKLETIPDGDGVTKWVAKMVTLLETKLPEARDKLNLPSRRSKRGALEEENSMDENQQCHQKPARIERVTDVIKGAIEANEFKDALHNIRDYADLGEVLLSVRTKELLKEGISAFIEVSDRACLCWAAIEAAIDPKYMKRFEEKRYAIARPFGATAYMPRMLAALVSNVCVVHRNECLEGGAYAKYEKMCSISESNGYYEVLTPFRVTLADGKEVSVEGCILCRRFLSTEETLQRKLDSLTEIGCTIEPHLAFTACYESAFTELMRRRGYHEYLKGIHAKPEHCVKTTIVENVIGVEVTGGGIVTVAFTHEEKNVLFRTNMIYMFKRVEMISGDDGRGLTFGELIETRRDGDDGLAKIAEKLLVWSTQLPWIHLGKSGREGHARWRRDMFASLGDPNAYSTSVLGEEVSALRHILWPGRFPQAPFEISEDVRRSVMGAVKRLRAFAMQHSTNSLGLMLFLEFSQKIPDIRARDWWTLDSFKYEVLDAAGALSESDDYKQNNPRSAWQRSPWKIDVIINTIMEKAENIREAIEDLQIVSLDALTKDGHVDHIFKRPRGKKVRKGLTSDDCDLITSRWECYTIFWNALVDTNITKQNKWWERKKEEWRSVVESSPEIIGMIQARKEEFRQFLLSRLTPPDDYIWKINNPEFEA